MAQQHKRMEREKKTIEAMLRIYCGRQHGRGEQLCEDCGELLEYARARLDKCPFGEGKGPCAKCEVHCYKPAMRKRVREVMRYSGPRMMKRHPVLAVRHLLDGRRKFERKK